ncbi:hypothetical protein GE09DRAFT_1136782 [Coniochaeta sp. 2T2.1]|nr:hypothetical protein GE09DRAFT_1136782 [Coniochaeta sp. 2T2.1]
METRITQPEYSFLLKMPSMTAITFRWLAVYTTLTGAVTIPRLSIRQDIAEHCVDDNLGYESSGNLYCVASDGTVPRCCECLGTCDDYAPLSAELGGTCYLTNGGEGGGLGIQIPCPGDPPPKETPDGSDPADIAGDYLDAWCAVAGEGGLFGWTTWAACYAWAIGSDDSNEEGIKAICDAFTMGLCTCYSVDLCDQEGGGGTG